MEGVEAVKGRMESNNKHNGGGVKGNGNCEGRMERFLVNVDMGKPKVAIEQSLSTNNGLEGQVWRYGKYELFPPFLRKEPPPKDLAEDEILEYEEPIAFAEADAAEDISIDSIIFGSKNHLNVLVKFNLFFQVTAIDKELNYQRQCLVSLSENFSFDKDVLLDKYNEFSNPAKGMLHLPDASKIFLRILLKGFIVQLASKEQLIHDTVYLCAFIVQNQEKISESKRRKIGGSARITVAKGGIFEIGISRLTSIAGGRQSQFLPIVIMDFEIDFHEPSVAPIDLGNLGVTSAAEIADDVFKSRDDEDYKWFEGLVDEEEKEEMEEEEEEEERREKILHPWLDMCEDLLSLADDEEDPPDTTEPYVSHELFEFVQISSMVYLSKRNNQQVRYIPYKQIPRARYFQDVGLDIDYSFKSLDRRPRSPVRKILPGRFNLRAAFKERKRKRNGESKCATQLARQPDGSQLSGKISSVVLQAVQKQATLTVMGAKIDTDVHTFVNIAVIWALSELDFFDRDTLSDEQLRRSGLTSGGLPEDLASCDYTRTFPFPLRSGPAYCRKYKQKEQQEKIETQKIIRSKASKTVSVLIAFSSYCHKCKRKEGKTEQRRTLGYLAFETLMRFRQDWVQLRQTIFFVNDRRKILAADGKVFKIYNESIICNIYARLATYPKTEVQIAGTKHAITDFDEIDVGRATQDKKRGSLLLHLYSTLALVQYFVIFLEKDNFQRLFVNQDPVLSIYAQRGELFKSRPDAVEFSPVPVRTPLLSTIREFNHIVQLEVEIHSTIRVTLIVLHLIYRPM
ncbi:hypothetical protein WN51_03047 [Melipona quadrifasciata]|uniref:Uncharacterized protein n=1 Tax=Melipona quadrifasciata TaxID=166423 RepID=A0A0N0U4D3_9HYME|nr:hypothetical protein WN51_03047 [Melipona quadrifasciata]